jgi:aryl-alcohol dehydrogenase-like predicted oxidoreductase
MDYRQLGYSGLTVSELSFGTGTLGEERSFPGNGCATRVYLVTAAKDG